MKKIFLFLSILLTLQTNAQLLVSSPSFLNETSASTTIIADASFGNKRLIGNTSDIFVHIGVITSLSNSGADWKYVASPWGTSDAKIKCVPLGNNKWSYTINTNLRSFFGITDASEKIVKIAILFRDAAGTNVLRNADGSDMYLDVYDNNLHVKIDSPLFQPIYLKKLEPLTKKIGDTIFINGKSNQNTNLKIFFNDTVLSTVSNTNTISAFKVINKVGTQKIYLSGTSNSFTDTDTAEFYVNDNQVLEDLPLGAVDGVNYLPGDTYVILVLYAPYKKSINVVGDFNNW